MQAPICTSPPRRPKKNQKQHKSLSPRMYAVYALARSDQGTRGTCPRCQVPACHWRRCCRETWPPRFRGVQRGRDRARASEPPLQKCIRECGHVTLTHQSRVPKRAMSRDDHSRIHFRSLEFAFSHRPRAFPHIHGRVTVRRRPVVRWCARRARAGVAGARSGTAGAWARGGACAGGGAAGCARAAAVGRRGRRPKSRSSRRPRRPPPRPRAARASARRVADTRARVRACVGRVLTDRGRGGRGARAEVVQGQDAGEAAEPGTRRRHVLVRARPRARRRTPRAAAHVQALRRCCSTLRRTRACWMRCRR